MQKFYIAQRKLWQIAINFVFVLQIIMFVMIFLLALHWLLNLAGSQLMSWLDPFATSASGFVKLFYKRMITLGGKEIDGSILLFDVILGLLIFALSYARNYFHRQIVEIDIIMDKVARDQEEAFNQQLQSDYEKEQLKKKNVAILIGYSLKNTLGNMFWADKETDTLEKKTEEVDKQIYYALSQLPGCQVAKSGAQFLLLSKNFDKIDMFLNYVNSVLAQVDEYVLKSHMTLTTYVAVEPYSPKSDTKQVFTTLNKLLALKMPGEIVCLGSFKLRYEFLVEHKYSTVLKGTYSIDDHDQVWSIIKKS